MHQQAAHPSYQSSEDHALSLAIAQSVLDQSNRQAGSGSAQTSHPLAPQRNASEALSLRYWKNHSLDYNDVITDGFYDIYGDFPEVCDGPHDFPTLENLRKVRTGTGDVREVTLVDHERDDKLLEAEESLSNAMAEANTQDVAERIKVVAHVVSDRFGGAYDSEATLEHCWETSSASAKRRSRSAVVLLCHLDEGSMRHRALLFKVLADAVHLPSKLIRGQALCGADNAANAMVMVNGKEFVVDLVFEPGRLFSQEAFARLVELRMASQDSWRRPPPIATAGSYVETSGLSASSNSSAGTLAGAGGSSTAVASLAAAGAGNCATGATALVAAAGPAGASAVASNASGAGPSQHHSGIPAPPVPFQGSPRTSVPRPALAVPLVPAPGALSASLPTGSAGLLGQGQGAGGRALGPGQHAQHGNSLAIAGSRVRFRITGLPESATGTQTQPPAERPRGESSATTPAAGCTAGGRARVGAAVASEPPSAQPGRHTAAPAAAGIPSKTRSMLDLPAARIVGGDGAAAGGGGHHATGSTGASDLIRLDSEPLPDMDAASGLPLPERSNTPTGSQSMVQRAPANRRQNSFDQNGWVKFSGSFTRTREEGRPPWANLATGAAGGGGGAGPSPLGPGAAACTAAPAAADGVATTAVSPVQQVQQQQQQVPAQGQVAKQPSSLELATSFTSISTAPSPDGTGGRPSGTNSLSPLDRGSGSCSGGDNTTVGARSTAGQPAPGVSTTIASTPFANYQLPAGLSVGLPGGGGPATAMSGGDAGPVSGGDTGIGGVGAGAVGMSHSGTALSGYGAGSGIGAKASWPASQSQTQPQPSPHQPQQQPFPPQVQQQQLALQIQQPNQAAQAQSQPQPPNGHGTQSVAAHPPFQAMPLGFATNMPLSSMPHLTAAFPALSLQSMAGPARPQLQLRPGQVAAQGAGGLAAAGPQAPMLPGQGPQPGTVPNQATGMQTSPQVGAGGVTLARPPQLGHMHPHSSRQHPNGSLDSGMTRQPNGAGAAPYTPPHKPLEMGGGSGPGGGGGSKAPSPSLSTPLPPNASSAQSATPPGSAPVEGVPFPNLSPFNQGEGGVGSTSRKDDRERDTSQYFSDLSPFNTATGTSSGGSGDVRDPTPSRGPGGTAATQPIVELPSSDNSRDTTPRVPYPSLASDPNVYRGVGGGASGPSSSGGGGGPQLQHGAGGGGAEQLTSEFARMQLAGAAARNGMRNTDGSLVHAGQQQQIQAYGGMAIAGAQQQAALQHHGQQQQSPQQQAMVYYTEAARLGNPYVYMPNGGMLGQGGYPPGQGQVGAAGSMPGWGPRPNFDGSWNPAWATHHQPYMQPNAFVQQQQALAAAGLRSATGAVHGGPERRFSQVPPTTTTPGVDMRTVESSSGADQRAGLSLPLGGGPPMRKTSQLGPAQQQQQLPSSGLPVALPPAPQPHQQQQQVPMQVPQPPQQPETSLEQLQLQGAVRPPVDLAHEMTMPSQQRLAAALHNAHAGVVPGGAGSGSGAAAGTSEVGAVDASSGGAADVAQDSSPLALQPSMSLTMPLPPAYKDLEIQPGELTFGDRIGIGSYGEVYRGTWRGTEVAIKRFLEQNLSPITIREFRDEVMIMSKLRHPNVVLFMGAVTGSNQLAIVTQFVQRGSLFRLLHRNKVPLTPQRRLSMALDIAKGMEYLHNCRPVLVHRDLKSPNLLVDRDWTIKVCDFGLSRMKPNTFLTAKSQGGSPAWMAPEILRGEQCDEKSDVFSFGVVLYELVTGKEPWEELNPMQVVGVVGFQDRRMDLPPDLDPEVSALIRSCWARLPGQRPSFTQILATMNTWSELRPTAAVLQQEAATRARHQRLAS